MKLSNNKTVLIIILISALLRGFLASVLELGNDEVYYWTYALYPDWSHYDHPPMVGLFIQLFSLNLSLDSEFFIRLASIVSGSVCAYFIYQIAKEIKNETTGIISVLLYLSSFYATVIVGVFILPDTPLCLFWLASVFLMLKIINLDPSHKEFSKHFILLGFAIAFALLSKYSGVLLWLGFLSYLFIYDRSKMRNKSFLIFNLICLLGLVPILYWNFTNDFASFQFHSGRIGLESLSFNGFFKELGGEFLYHNPIVFGLTLLAILNWCRRRLNIQPKYIRLLFFISLPLIFMVFAVSLFRSSLPHWSGPAYLTLLILPAIYIQQKSSAKLKYGLISFCILILFSGLAIGYSQIKNGVFKLDEPHSMFTKGQNDPSLDMVGWEQLADQFALGYQQDLKDKLIDKNTVLISDRWFPAAHLDYYVARPLGLKLLLIGSIEDQHKYHWINAERGLMAIGDDAYYITLSTMYNNPKDSFSEYFEYIDLSICIPILRNDEIVKYAFVYNLHNLKKNLR